MFFVSLRRARIRLTDRIFGPGALTGTDYGTAPYRLDLRGVDDDHRRGLCSRIPSGGWSNSKAIRCCMNLGMNPCPADVNGHYEAGHLIIRPVNSMPTRTSAMRARRVNRKVRAKPLCALSPVLKPLRHQRYYDRRNTLVSAAQRRSVLRQGTTIHMHERYEMDSNGGWMRGRRPCAILDACQRICHAAPTFSNPGTIAI